MSLTIKAASTAGLLFVLGACGSSSPTTEVVARASNGLPFAAEDIGAQIAGLSGSEALNLIFNSIGFNEDGSASVSVGEEVTVTFTPGDDPGDLEARNGTLEIDFGDGPVTFEVVDGFIDLGGAESVELTEELRGVASVLLSTTYVVDGNTLAKDYFVVGFETSQADMDALAAVDAGAATYSGDFVGIGNATNAGLAENLEFFTVEAVSLAGTVGIEVDFASGAVGGNLDINEITVISSDFNAFTSMNGDVLSLAFDPSTLNGNSFAMTGASVNSCEVCVAGIVNSAELGGTFYGADAAEVSGLAAFDVDITDDFTGIDDSFNLTGIGGYIAGKEPVFILLTE